MAKSSNDGANIIAANSAEAEVTSISAHGFWLYLGGRELFVSFNEFPWFADAPVRKIANLRWQKPDHLHWPDLDIDLSVESIEHPERFPPRQPKNSLRLKAAWISCDHQGEQHERQLALLLAPRPENCIYPPVTRQRREVYRAARS